MKVFDGIPPNAGHQSIQQGPKALIERARHLYDGRAEWPLSEPRPGIEDSQSPYDRTQQIGPNDESGKTYRGGFPKQSLLWRSMLKDLFYKNKNKWVEIPAWACYFLDTGAVAAAAAGPRLVLCLAVPSRSYAAALAACGIVTVRAASHVEQSSPAEHFELICNLPNSAPVSLFKEGKKLRGVFDGVTECYGEKCARIMVRQKSAGGASYLIREVDSLQVEILAGGPVILPKRQSGRLIPSMAPFARHILGDKQAQAFVRQSRFECVITGPVNILKREIEETEFAISGSRAGYHEGNLQSLLRVRRFLNGSESYRSDISSVNRKSPSFARRGEIPPFVIFDGAAGFIRWRDYLSDSNWVVILSRMDTRFREAAEVLNQAYRNRSDDNMALNLPPAPAGVEVMSFYA